MCVTHACIYTYVRSLDYIFSQWNSCNIWMGLYTKQSWVGHSQSDKQKCCTNCVHPMFCICTMRSIPFIIWHPRCRTLHDVKMRPCDRMGARITIHSLTWWSSAHCSRMNEFRTIAKVFTTLRSEHLVGVVKMRCYDGHSVGKYVCMWVDSTTKVDFCGISRWLCWSGFALEIPHSMTQSYISMDI